MDGERSRLPAVADLLLAEAAERPGPGPVLVIDEPDAALALAATWAEVRAHCDRLDAERRLPGRPLPRLDDAAFAGTRLVLLAAPTSLDRLDEIAGRAARHGVPLLAGGRVRHLHRGLNAVLERHYGRVEASLGRRKARVLRAFDPRPDAAPTWPRERELRLPDGRRFTLVHHGGVFAGGRLDPGTRLLLGVLPDALGGRRVLDFGCGSGMLTLALAASGARVTALDVSALACASTRASLAANGLTADVVRADGLAGQASGSVDILVTNPPFHAGVAKDSTATLTMFADARRVLAPGGELWAVWNSHLPYLNALRRGVGRTTIMARDRAFTVTRSSIPVPQGT